MQVAVLEDGVLAAQSCTMTAGGCTSEQLACVMFCVLLVTFSLGGVAGLVEAAS